jgi:ring-1,2-phenylacetyl-CoA epoxidase subunit PaaD
MGDPARNETETRAWAVLSGIPDPEIPVISLVELGIVHAVRSGAEGVEVDLMPTYTGCPATEVIETDVRQALDDAGLGPVSVRRVLAPAWTTDFISDAGRRKLADYGIAPPSGKAGKRSVFGDDRPAACPRCGSADTSRVSEFGSTPCKASWRCEQCLEPFEYFKCL